MIELSAQQLAIILSMEPGAWYTTADLARNGLNSTTLSRILRQLTEPGLLARELIRGGQRRYQYHLTALGLKRRAQEKHSRFSPAPPNLGARLADWKRLGREVGSWLKEWLGEFIP